jgi:hypothetical protein
MKPEQLTVGIDIQGEQTGSGVLAIGSLGQVFVWTLPEVISPAKKSKGYGDIDVYTTNGLVYPATVLSVSEQRSRTAALMYLNCPVALFKRPRLRYMHGRLKTGHKLRVVRWENGKPVIEETRVRLDQRGFTLYFDNVDAQLGSPVFYDSGSLPCLFGLVAKVGNAGATNVPSLMQSRGIIVSDVMPRR